MESFKNKMLSEMAVERKTDAEIEAIRKKYGIKVDPATGKPVLKDTEQLRKAFRQTINPLVRGAVRDGVDNPKIPTKESLSSEERLERIDEFFGAIAGGIARLAGGAAARGAAGAAAKGAAGAAAKGAAGATVRTASGRTLSQTGSMVAKRLGQMKKSGTLPATMGERRRLAISMNKAFAARAGKAGSAATRTSTINPAAASRLKRLKMARQQGLMDAGGKLTGLGQAKTFVGKKIAGIADPNLKALATGLSNRGFAAANVARQSLASSGAGRGLAGAAIRTAMRNPMTTMAVGSMVANRLRSRQQPATGGY